MSLKIVLMMLAFGLSQTLWADQEEVTVTGVLQGVYDFEDELVGVRLITDDRNFFIGDDLKGRELFAHVGKQVEIAGTWNKFDDEEDVIYVLKVTAYRLLQSTSRGCF
jgi:hypothetical protein